MRLDQYLVARQLVPTRSRAHALIMEGYVSIQGKTIEKASYIVADDMPPEDVHVSDPCRYVGRGGLKLEAALHAFSLDLTGETVLDVGASSGGFTDCALQHGAATVYAVDAGQGQLAPALRADPRVYCRENYNARYLSLSDLPGQPTVAVMDVSFISQTLILPALSTVLPAGGKLVSLIKPQFEAGRAAVGRGGIVRGEKDRQAAIARVQEAAQACGFSCAGVIQSPITGGDGNIEYLGYFVKRS